jgi:hypothetical protein
MKLQKTRKSKLPQIILTYNSFTYALPFKNNLVPQSLNTCILQ